MLVAFISEYIWLITLLLTIGMAGAFVLAPFAQEIKYSIFISPMMGLLFLIGATEVIYTIGLSLPHSALIALIGLIILGGYSIKIYDIRFLTIEKSLLIGIVLVTLFITLGVEYTTITSGNPGILFYDGGDAAEYAHLSDWFQSHPISSFPILSSKQPYQIMINLCYFLDSRFEAFIGLSLVSMIRDISPFFSYDMTCAIILSISIIAIAALFTQTPSSFILLLMGLCSSFWYDYSRAGYLGKILGYPSTLLCLGLFFHAIKKTSVSITQLTVLLWVAALTAGLHSPIATAVLLFTTGGIYLLATFVLERHPNTGMRLSIFEMKQKFVLWSLFASVPLISSGLLSRPFPKLFPVFLIPWKLLTAFYLDLESPGAQYSGLTYPELHILGVLSLSIVFVFLYIGIKNNLIKSVALMLTPLALFSILALLKKPEVIFQMGGVSYPFILCGMAGVIDHRNVKLEKKLYTLLATMFILLIGMHLPRVLGAINRYTYGAPHERQFSKPELDRIPEFTKHEPIKIDTAEAMYILPIMIELGRHDISLQYTPEAWQVLFGSRADLLPMPKSKPAPTPWSIQIKSMPIPSGCISKYETAQYRLIFCTKGVLHP